MSDQSQLPPDAQSVSPAPEGGAHSGQIPVPGEEARPSFDGTQAAADDSQGGVDPVDYAALYEAERQRAAQLEAQQQQVFQVARQVGEAQRQQALQSAQARMRAEEEQLRQWALQSENPEQALAEVQAYYRRQNEQVLNLARMYVEHHAQQTWTNNMINQYGSDLTPEDIAYLQRIHPNDMPVIAESLRARNKRERQMEQEIANLRSRDQANQIMQSGAHRMGGLGGTTAGSAGQLPPGIKPGTHDHLAWLMGISR